MIMVWHRSNETSKRLHYVPGVGPLLATALVASVADPRTFRSGRNFSAWIGLVPKQHSSGGKDRLGSISKQGDRYLRSLFVAGALAVIRYAKMHGTKHRPWLTALLTRRPTKVAAIALANKLARMAWAMLRELRGLKRDVLAVTIGARNAVDGYLVLRAVVRFHSVSLRRWQGPLRERRIERVSFLAFRTKGIQAVEMEARCIFDRVAARFLSQLAGLNQRSGKLSGSKSIVISHVLISFFHGRRRPSGAFQRS